MIEPGHEKLSLRRQAAFLGISRNRLAVCPRPARASWEEDQKALRELLDSLRACGGHDRAHYLRRYLEFMTTPERHRDTYLEECHRNFFAKYAHGKKPEDCGGEDIRIGGLAHVPVLAVWSPDDESGSGRPSLVRRHLSHCARSAGCLMASDLRFASIPTSRSKRAMPTLWRWWTTAPPTGAPSSG